MRRSIIGKLLPLIVLILTTSSLAADLKEGDVAPVFQAKTHDGKDFDMAHRTGKWTVLYFFPKAETPGCTKQACSFRDSIKKVRDLNADVFGVSSDSQKDLQDFHKHHDLKFTLLADPELTTIEKYGVKAPVFKISRRWTFIIDPQLKIRRIDHVTDPVKDAENVARAIKKFQAEPSAEKNKKRG